MSVPVMPEQPIEGTEIDPKYTVLMDDLFRALLGVNDLCDKCILRAPTGKVHTELTMLGELLDLARKQACRFYYRKMKDLR